MMNFFYLIVLIILIKETFNSCLISNGTCLMICFNDLDCMYKECNIKTIIQTKELTKSIEINLKSEYYSNKCSILLLNLTSDVSLMTKSLIGNRLFDVYGQDSLKTEIIASISDSNQQKFAFQNVSNLLLSFEFDKNSNCNINLSMKLETQRSVTKNDTILKNRYLYSASKRSKTNETIIFGGIMRLPKSANFNNYQQTSKIGILDINLSETASFESNLIPVYGHSSIYHEKSNNLFIFFGYSSKFNSYLNNLIQIFNFSTNTSSQIRFNSTFNIGYGHLSVLNSQNGVIYLYGGLNTNVRNEYYFNTLYEFTPETLIIRMLKSNSAKSSSSISLVVLRDLLVLSTDKLDEERFYNITNNNWYLNKTNSLLIDNSDHVELLHDYNNCYSCLFNSGIWFDDNCFRMYNITMKNQLSCELKTQCEDLKTCLNCNMYSYCIWNEIGNVCLNKNSIKILYSKDTSFLHKLVDNKSQCLPNDYNLICMRHSSCNSCINDDRCGWCALDESSGYGICTEGGYKSSLNSSYCSTSSNWYYNSCPLCNCNGHSECFTNTTRCISCLNNTFNEENQCSQCLSGYYGNPLNNGICYKCKCNPRQSNSCDTTDGRCFCSTKGVIGKYCNQCETPRYISNPFLRDITFTTCYYDLSTDYQFTFNLNKETDKYYTSINFSNRPFKVDDDIDMAIKCLVTNENMPKFNLTYSFDALNYVNNDSNGSTVTNSFELSILNDINCTFNEYRYTISLKNELKSLNVKNLTFFLYLSQFKTPITIQVSFSYRSKLQLMHFFLTFFGCFVSLLSLSFVFWKGKQKYDRYRRQRQVMIEMKDMANRPFAKLNVNIDDLNNSLIENNYSKDDDKLSPIALEPLLNNKSAILTVLLKLPQSDYSNLNNSEGSSPFILASTLVSIQQPNEESL